MMEFPHWNSPSLMDISRILEATVYVYTYIRCKGMMISYIPSVLAQFTALKISLVEISIPPGITLILHVRHLNSRLNIRLKNMIALCKSSRLTVNFDSSGINKCIGQASKIIRIQTRKYHVKFFFVIFINMMNL
jgi:hypothetical protein